MQENDSFTPGGITSKNVRLLSHIYIHKSYPTCTIHFSHVKLKIGADDPEEIRKWIEERKKKYPTDANIEKKVSVFILHYIKFDFNMKSIS
jgi:hypothetical protein